MKILETYPKKTKLLRLIILNSDDIFLPFFQFKLVKNIRKNTSLTSTGTSLVYNRKYKIQHKLGFFDKNTKKKTLLKVRLRQMNKSFNIYNLKIETTKKEYE